MKYSIVLLLFIHLALSQTMRPGDGSKLNFDHYNPTIGYTMDQDEPPAFVFAYSEAYKLGERIWSFDQKQGFVRFANYTVADYPLTLFVSRGDTEAVSVQAAAGYADATSHVGVVFGESAYAFYGFVIDAEQQLMIYSRKGEETRELYRASSPALSSTINTLTIAHHESTITFYLNNTLFASIANISLSGRTTGVTAQGRGIFGFDNYQQYTLTETVPQEASVEETVSDDLNLFIEAESLLNVAACFQHSSFQTFWLEQTTDRIGKG